ncbi:MAG: EI24 domain-containing protein [Armatimonadetes bacterium]|nr:EI24 domain-containing protein [Armatimonadota bacterium]
MLTLLKGLHALLSRPKLWGYSWKPLAWAACLYLVVLIIGQWLIVPRLSERIPGTGWLDWTVSIAGAISITLLWVVAANFILVAVSALFSSFLWGRLSLEAEEAIYGDAPHNEPGCGVAIMDTVFRLLMAIVVVGATLLLGWLGPIVGAAAAGFLSLIDFSAPAYFRRGIAFPAQLKVLSTKSAPGFMIGCGLASLVPFAFVLAMPAMVIGGTIQCREAEGPKGPRPFRSGSV